MIDACDAFDQMHLGCMGKTTTVEPEFLVETRSIDNESVTFPMADCIAQVPVGNNIRRRMNAARFHVNDLPYMIVAGNHNYPVQLGLLNDFHSIRQLPEMDAAVRYTSCMRIIFGIRGLPVLKQRFRPWLKRNLFYGQVSR